MGTYFMFLFMIAATSVTIIIVAGCAFMALGMWVAVKDRLDRL